MEPEIETKMEASTIQDLTESDKKCGHLSEISSDEKVFKWLRNSINISVPENQSLKVNSYKLKDQNSIEIAINTLRQREFIHQYETTTELLGMSGAENLFRLRRSLKNDAERCLKALMLTSNTTMSIVEISRNWFERPDLLVHLVQDAGN